MLIEIAVQTDGEAAEAVSALLTKYSRAGTVVEELWSDAGTALQVQVKTFLPAGDTALVQQIEEALWHLAQLYPMPGPSIRHLTEAEWMGAWKSGYRVQRFGRRIVVKPSWRQYAAAPDQVVIELDPGLAFGTGLHPSTGLSLLALEESLHVGDRVLDVGTGSGILSIAAAKLGASRVVALDIDPLALQVAGENVTRNGVQDVVSLQRASLSPVVPHEVGADSVPLFSARACGGPFDLLVMNILADTIASSAEAIAACLIEAGLFIVSGIIEQQESRVRQAFDLAGLQVTQRRVKKDWVALGGRRAARQRATE